MFLTAIYWNVMIKSNLGLAEN